MKVIILSGRSGAGKTVALRVMEDLGYYCVDNLPIELLPKLTRSLKLQTKTLAVSLDIRNLPAEKIDGPALKAMLPKVDIKMFFLDASNDRLLRRYSETRRIHPLSHDGKTLAEAIETEGERLQPLIDLCDYHIGTDDLSVYDLADQIRAILLGKPTTDMQIVFESFGFKYGMPKQADFMFDVRFLPNPHWHPELRAHTGLERPVIDFFQQQPDVGRFIDNTERFLQNWLPQLERNNRAYLTIAIGCTGGKHRSVYICEALAKRFKVHKKQVHARHREQNLHV